MGRIDPPRTTGPFAGVAATEERQPAEPATGRALWPTFMRRTLDEHLVGVAPADPPRGA